MRENPGPLDPMAVRRVFERIIDESRRLERLAADGAGAAPEAEEQGVREPMVIVMERTATRGADPEGHRGAGGGRLRRAPLDRRHPHRAGRGGLAAARRWTRTALELLPGRARGRQDLRALQAGGPHLQGRGHRGGHGRGEGGRAGGHRDGRALLGGDARAGARGGAARCRPRARACCAAAPSSRARRPTPSRATARRRCAGCARRPTRLGLAVISEVMDLRTIEMMLRYVDCLQVGRAQHAELRPAEGAGQGAPARAAQARHVAPPSRSGCSPPSTSWPAATTQVILCERGIRTFENATRNTLDISAIPVVKKLSHLPDPGGPEPRHRPPRQGDPHGPRGGGGGRGRPAHRGAQRPREGALATARRACTPSSSTG